MKWYLQNLRCGLRTAFFFPTSERFVGTWHALMAITVTFILSQALIEFAVDGPGGTLAYSWPKYMACLFSFTMIAAYLVGHIAGKGQQVLELAVAFLNSYFFIFVFYAFAIIHNSGAFYKTGLHTLALELIPVWGFLVMFRLAGTLCAAEIKRLIVAGLIAAGSLCILNAHVYLNRIYYVEPPEEQEETSPLDTLTSEEIFNMQAPLREKTLEKLTVSKPGQTDIYALTLASYAYQSVFLRDVNYVDARLQDKLHIANIIPMVNNKSTVLTIPLANTTNLAFYLHELATHYMQPKEDILLIYLTSHGSAKTGLSVNLEYELSLLNLSQERLQKMLKDSGIQNKVIIISACYSGSFIPYLKDDHTMIMTAAASDRVSFGCSDTSNLTYFTQAYFMDGLSRTTDLEKAFDVAKASVLKREQAQGITILSNPQIFIGDKIKDILANYKAAKIASPDNVRTNASGGYEPSNSSKPPASAR
jgi:hypothetical protein